MTANPPVPPTGWAWQEEILRQIVSTLVRGSEMPPPQFPRYIGESWAENDKLPLLSQSMGLKPIDNSTFKIREETSGTKPRGSGSLKMWPSSGVSVGTGRRASTIQSSTVMYAHDFRTGRMFF